MGFKRALPLFLACPSAMASTNEDVLNNASDVLSRWLGSSVATIRNGTECRGSLRIVPLSDRSSSRIPRLTIDTFDPGDWHTSRAEFWFDGRMNDDSCKMITHEESNYQEIQVHCAWQECETHGCTDVQHGFKFRKTEYPDSFSVKFDLEIDAFKCRETYDPPGRD